MAGFIAGSLTGAAIAVGFWGIFYPVRDAQLTFHLPVETVALAKETLPHVAAEAVKQSAQWITAVDLPIGKWLGLTTLGVVSGLISGVAEALGAYLSNCR